MTSGITLSQLTADEKHLLSLLLAGEDEPFVSLRAQLAQLWVVARRESPTGVIVDVRIPDDVPRAPLPRLDLSDVGFEIGASKQRGTATVRVEGGAILQLEMVTPAGAWRPGKRIRNAGWIAPSGEPVAIRDVVALGAQLAAPPPDPLDGLILPDLGERGDGIEADEPELDLSPRPEDTIGLALLVPLAPVFHIALPLLPDDELPDAAPLHADPRLERAESRVLATRLGMRLLEHLPSLIGPETAAEWLDVAELDLPVPTLVRRWKAWARKEEPEPVIAAIAAALLVADRGDGLLDEPAQPMARELFHYVRRRGILSWADAHEHAQGWWGAPGDRIWPIVVRSFSERLTDAIDELDLLDERARKNAAKATSGDSVGGSGSGAAVGGTAGTVAPGIPAPASGAAEAIPQPPAPSPLERELEEMRADRARRQKEVERLQLDVEKLRVARKQLRERVRTLEAEVVPLQEERDRVSRDARALRRLLAEAREAAEAGSPDPIPDPPEDGWPPDLLAGLNVILCTGQDRGGARTAMADELRLAGAEVTLYEANAKGIPDRFPADALVVCDIRFVSHPAAARVRLAAERTGARMLEVRAGQGGIVRAVAAGCGRQ